MEETKHILLIGDGAMRFAESQSVSMENDDYFYSEFRYKQLQQAKSGGKAVLDHSVFETDRIKKKGTVGAVALDQMGNLAAATSTGGMTNKRKGRVGDTALIGSGTYADNRSAAISCTGDGEEFIRHAIAYDVHAQMIYGNKTLQEAVDFAIHKRLQPDDGGLIAIDSNGLIVCDYNSSGMFRAYSNPDSGDHIKIWE